MNRKYEARTYSNPPTITHRFGPLDVDNEMDDDIVNVYPPSEEYLGSKPVPEIDAELLAALQEIVAAFPEKELGLIDWMPVGTFLPRAALFLVEHDFRPMSMPIRIR